jgi:hypothetical protein
LKTEQLLQEKPDRKVAQAFRCILETTFSKTGHIKQINKCGPFANLGYRTHHNPVDIRGPGPEGIASIILP